MPSPTFTHRDFDVNGDGNSDLIVAANAEWAHAYWYPGTSTGLDTTQTCATVANGACQDVAADAMPHMFAVGLDAADHPVVERNLDGAERLPQPAPRRQPRSLRQ